MVTQKINIELPLRYPHILLLGTCLEELKIGIQTDICVFMFMTVHNSQELKNNSPLSTNE